MICCATLILLFFGFCFSSCSHLPKRKYYYVDMKMNWTDAQHYCREKYTDLATFESMDDISRLQSDPNHRRAWIGLRDDPKSWKGVMGNDTNSWRWSATGQTSKTGYHNWNAREPDNAGGSENCALIGNYGDWYDSRCQNRKSFVCYNVTNRGEKTYVFISSAKRWSPAQAYCREHYTDLAMIENTAENNKVRSSKPANATGWIGLYRVPWTWSDKTQSSFESWQRGTPNNVGGDQFCANQTPKHKWNDSPCDEKYAFICHKVSKLKTTLRMKIQTDADITDPAINAQVLQQLGAVLTSQGWTDFNLQWKIQPRKQEGKDALKTTLRAKSRTEADINNPAQTPKSSSSLVQC